MRVLTELFNRKFYNLIMNLSVCTMEELTRRQTFKTAAAATAGGALLTTTGSQPAKAESEYAGCDVDSKHGTTSVSDARNDGSIFIDPDDGSDDEHGYKIYAKADVHDDPDNCKETDTTTFLWQERRDCTDDSTYLESIDSVRASQEYEGEAENSQRGVVANHGDGWVATGIYKVKVYSVLYGHDKCNYNWDENEQECWDSCSVSERLVECEECQEQDSGHTCDPNWS